MNDWKESYDLLVSEFRKLKFEMVVEKEELIKEMKGLSDVSVQAKVSGGGRGLPLTIRGAKTGLLQGV